jgi:hypothetical protein
VTAGLRPNVSAAGRLLRGVGGALLMGLAVARPDAAGDAVLAYAAGGLALFTGISGFCPLLALFRPARNRPR